MGIFLLGRVTSYSVSKIFLTFWLSLFGTSNRNSGLDFSGVYYWHNKEINSNNLELSHSSFSFNISHAQVKTNRPQRHAFIISFMP